MELAYPTQHLQQFRALQKDFLKFGITIDSACSDVCRLRCLSYDNKLFINENAVPYKGVEHSKRNTAKFKLTRDDLVDNTNERVYMACKKIEQLHIDMTSVLSIHLSLFHLEVQFVHEPFV